jgi:hypothetical protein
MDAHAQISSPASLLVTLSEKPLLRSDKGFIMRKEAYLVYENEIAAAHSALEMGTRQYTGSVFFTKP